MATSFINEYTHEHANVQTHERTNARTQASWLPVKFYCVFSILGDHKGNAEWVHLQFSVSEVLEDWLIRFMVKQSNIIPLL